MINRRFNILALILAILIIFTGCVASNNDTDIDIEDNLHIETQDRTGNDAEEPASNNLNYEDEQDREEQQSEQNDQEKQEEEQELGTETTIDENGTYTDPFEVAEYIHTYDKLPSNFITKNEARNLGWQSDKGNLWDVTDEMSIGGDKFGNREGLLPKKEGRIYYECDVNYEGGYRGAERLVFSNDGLIFYTDDHYGSFTQLY